MGAKEDELKRVQEAAQRYEVELKDISLKQTQVQSLNCPVTVSFVLATAATMPTNISFQSSCICTLFTVQKDIIIFDLRVPQVDVFQYLSLYAIGTEACCIY